MKIYYFMIHAVPKKDNPETEDCIGAYVNCWVKRSTYPTALKKAKEYIDSEGWTVTHVEDAFVAQREWYIDDPEALEYYDLACEYGVAGIFYTYETEEEDDDDDDDKNTNYQ